MEDYVNKANDETLVTVLFEDIVAINSLEEIVTVDHIEVFYVAPGDLAQSMILTGQIPHPDVKAAVDQGIQDNRRCWQGRRYACQRFDGG